MLTPLKSPPWQMLLVASSSIPSFLRSGVSPDLIWGEARPVHLAVPMMATLGALGKAVPSLI